MPPADRPQAADARSHPRRAIFTRLAAAALALVALVACASAPPTPGGAAAAEAQAVLTLLHINDLHEMLPGDLGRLGGIARVATVVERERRAGTPMLVTLGGDFLSPSALSTAVVDGQPLAGRQAVSALNRLGLDWATFGNHEFDLSEAQFLARMKEMTFGMVSSNVTGQDGRPFEGSVPHAIATVRLGARDLRIGLIGLTIDFNRKAYVRYLPAVEAARAQIKALAGRTDAIVALTHLGLPGDQALAEGVPEIDLILGGHEHENAVVRRGDGFTTIAKADANGKSLVRATLAFGAPGTRPQVDVSIQRLDRSVPPDPAMTAEVGRWTEAAFAGFRRAGFDPDAVVVMAPEALDGREGTVRVRQGNLTDLIVAALAREARDVDVAILNGGSIRVDDLLPAGPVTEYDIIRVLPFGGKVVKTTMDGALLAEVLDAGAANRGVGGFLHVRGAVSGPTGWQVGGAPLDRARRYTAAMPEFLMTGGETRMAFLNRQSPRVHAVEELRDIRQAVIDELRARWGERRRVSRIPAMLELYRLIAAPLGPTRQSLSRVPLGRVRSLLRVRSTMGQREQVSSWPSIPLACHARFSRLSFSDRNGAPLLARCSVVGTSSKLTRAVCSWTRLPSCRSRPKRYSYGCWPAARMCRCRP